MKNSKYLNFIFYNDFSILTVCVIFYHALPFYFFVQDNKIQIQRIQGCPTCHSQPSAKHRKPAASKKMLSFRKDNSSRLYSNHFLKKEIRVCGQVKPFFFPGCKEEKHRSKGKPPQSSLYTHGVPPPLISVLTCPAVKSTIPPFQQKNFPRACFRNSEPVVCLILYTCNLLYLIKTWIN